MHYCSSSPINLTQPRPACKRPNGVFRICLPSRNGPSWVGCSPPVRALPVLSGDIPQAIFLARQALALLPETEVIPRAVASRAAARAYLVSGDVTLATEREVAAPVALIRTSDNPYDSCEQYLRAGTAARPARQAPAGRRHLSQVVQAVPRAEVLQTFFRASPTISAWVTCCASGTNWRRLNITWRKAWRWSKRH